MAKAKAKRDLGIAQAVNEVKDNLMSIEEFKTMKITMLELKTLVEYPDNEKVFGNLEGQDFQDLCNSIKDRGILQPIIVQPMEDQYQILAGHQRSRASKEIGELKIPAIIKDSIDDDEARLIWLETNIRGRQLSDEKRGKALLEAQKIIDKKRGTGEIQYTGKTSELLAEKFDMKPRSVEDLLMIAKKVAESVQELGLNKATMKEFAKLEKAEQEALLSLLGEDTVKELTAQEVKKAVETAKLEIDSTYKEKLNDVQLKVQEKDKELNKINITYQDMRMELGKITHEKANILLEIENEKAEKQRLESELKKANSTDKEALEKEIQKKEDEIAKMMANSEELAQKLEEINKKMEDVLDEKKVLEEDYANLEHDYQMLYEQNKKQILENVELKKKLEEAKKPSIEIEKMKTELAEYKKNEQTEHTLRKLLSEFSNIKTSVSVAAMATKDLKCTTDIQIELRKKLNSAADEILQDLQKILKF